MTDVNGPYLATTNVTLDRQVGFEKIFDTEVMKIHYEFTTDSLVLVTPKGMVYELNIHTLEYTTLDLSIEIATAKFSLWDEDTRTLYVVGYAPSNWGQTILSLVAVQVTEPLLPIFLN
jgi:hypothetical protein